MNYFSSDFTLGVLGGGQLGKMLLYETRKYDITTKVLDPNIEAPARWGCNEFVQGDLMDFDTVYQFGKQVDILTIEIEGVNILALEKLEQEGVQVYPSSKTLRLIQNKATQKQFYKQYGIPTSDFRVFSDKNQLLKSIEKQEVNLPFVWKSTLFGYDGNGVKIVNHISDLQHLPTGACIAEEKIDFQCELAVIVARNVSGETKVYPVVEMEFHPEANQVEYVICPARIPSEIADKATQIAQKVSETFDHVGVLAVEMFLTKNGEILVNEVAPRPHNSGHYTIEGAYTTQFEQHLRAILNLPLGQTKSKLATVMVNLVGKDPFVGSPIYKNIDKVLSISGVTPHIYGKKTTYPFRKMGHITIVDEHIDSARKTAEKVKNLLSVESI